MKLTKFVHVLKSSVNIPMADGDEIIDAVVCLPPNFQQALTMMTLEQIGSKYRENVRRAALATLNKETIEMYRQAMELSETSEADPFAEEMKKAVEKKKAKKGKDSPKLDSDYIEPDDEAAFAEIKHSLYAHLSPEELQTLHSEFIKLLNASRTNKLFRASEQDDKGLSDGAVRLMSLEDKFMLMVKYLYFFTHFSP